MAVEFGEVDVPAYHQWSAIEVIDATEGQSFKAETSPGGQEFFIDAPVVPAGKIHKIRVEVTITEHDE